MTTTRFFTGGEVARADVDYPSPTSNKVKEREDLYLYSLSGPSWSVLGPNLPLPFYPPVIIMPKSQYTPTVTGHSLTSLLQHQGTKAQ